jgi:ATP-binding cassette subfamily B protein
MTTEASTRDAARWLLRVAFREDRKLAVLAFLPLAPFCLGIIAVSGRTIINQSIAGNRGAVIAAAVTAGVAFVLMFAGGYWQASTSLLKLREAAAIAIDEDVLELTSSVPTLDHLDHPDYLDRLEMLRAGRFPLTQTVGLLRDIMFMVASLAITSTLLILVDPRLFLLPLSVVPVAWIYYRSQRAVSMTERAVAERRRTALHLFDVGTGFAEGKELRVGRHEATLQRLFASVSASIDDDLSRADRRAAITRICTWLLFAGAVAAGLILAIRDPVHDVTPGGIFLTVTVIAQLADQTAYAATTATTLKNTLDLAKHFLSLQEHASDLQPSAAHEATSAPARLDHGLQLEQVTFSYGDATTPAVTDVSVTLKAGTSVAIVGENGAGKTTLVKLLCGLYRPDAGTISLDGTAMESIAAASWSERLTAVSQDFVRFEFVARESIGVGSLPLIDDREAVMSAVSAAHADDLVDQLPAALDTQLGPRFGGVDLSGGQWQRLAVARAMMREEPLLIAFDEPTVAIDATTERLLVDQLVDQARRLARSTGAVVVYVSHRYSTVRAADEIIVMEQGRIAEHGSHAELLAHDGIYAETYRRQVATYE